MTQNENPAPQVCVPVSTSGDPCPNGLQTRALEAQKRAALNPPEVETGRPDTRSPLDPWHTEGYLIRCLIHLHGWTHQEAGVLRRFRRG